MKRDMELVRKILLKVEESDEQTFSGKFRVDGYDDILVTCHVQLLQEAGLLQANVVETQIGPTAAFVDRLTWAGHEFLDAARNETVWERTMSFLKTKGGSVPMEVLKALLIAKAKEWTGLEV